MLAFTLGGCLGAIEAERCESDPECGPGEACDPTGACIAAPVPAPDARPHMGAADVSPPPTPDAAPASDGMPSPDAPLPPGATRCRADAVGPPCNGCPPDTIVPAGFVCVPAGRFTMGSPPEEAGRYPSEVEHSVQLTRPFLMKQTEVTQAEWLAVMASSPARFTACGPNCPVESVNWFDAATFANHLSDAEGRPRCHDLRNCSGMPGGGCGDATFCDGGYTCDADIPTSPDCAGYRLPTEAEWEYAVRAGTLTSTYIGNIAILGDVETSNNAPGLDPIAWYAGNSAVRYAGAYDCSGIPDRPVAASRCGPHAVGELDANAWGLHDMLGNVWEWTADRFGAFTGAPETDPTGPAVGAGTLRGGAWGNFARFVRSAHRGQSERFSRNIDIGFRVVRTVTP